MPDPTPAKGAPVEAKADKPKPDQVVAAGDKPVEDWKPEPRQWTWKDLFTAPMLAFKPKCMLIAAVTLTAITAWMWLFDTKIVDSSHGLILQSVLQWLQYTVALVLFSLGGTLVAVFLKADLLDDEFLSFGEAMAQYRTRIMPAVMVPLFLMGLLAGVHLALVYLPVLFCSIPYFGPFVYSLMHPLLFLFSLFVVLLGIAIWLSVFVFPAIIAIRKHGWFDNVVDTIEAVGTKPHVLFGSLLLSLVMMFIALRIGMGGIEQLKGQVKYLPDSAKDAIRDTEARANEFYAGDMLKLLDRHVLRLAPLGDVQITGANSALYNKGENQFYQYWTGPVTGLWQVLIQALIVGYVANLFIAGGMLTYLVVREDDYWDDEDLEDLDKLAKELEEEAKRDQAAPAPAAAPAPVAVVEVPKVEPVKPAEPIVEAKPTEPPPPPATPGI
jgi:hypothetical protein